MQQLHQAVGSMFLRQSQHLLVPERTVSRILDGFDEFRSVTNERDLATFARSGGLSTRELQLFNQKKHLTVAWYLQVYGCPGMDDHRNWSFCVSYHDLLRIPTLNTLSERTRALLEDLDKLKNLIGVAFSMAMNELRIKPETRQALTHSIKSRNKPNACLKCGNICHRLCAGCMWFYYCSKECQREDWKVHKDDCELTAYVAKCIRLIATIDDMRL
jgi:hypothetical protein